MDSLAVAFLLFVAGYLLYTKLRPSALSSLPGPPSRSFLLGNLADFSETDAGLISIGKIDMEAWFISRADRLLITDPRSLQHILQTTTYTWRKWSEKKEFDRRTTGYGLLWADGDTHKRHRKVMQPAFSASEAKAFLPLFSSRAALITTKWNDMLVANGELTATVDINWFASRATLDAIGQAAFDYDFGVMNNTNNEFAAVYQSLLFMGRSGALGLPSHIEIFLLDVAGLLPRRVLAWLTEHGRGPRFETIRKAEQIANQVSKEVLDERQREFNSLGSGSLKKDLMSLLLKANASANPLAQLSEIEIISQIRTIAWTLMELVKNPEIQARLREEIRKAERLVSNRNGNGFTVKDFEEMSYLGAVLKESLRFHPVAVYLHREASEDDVLPLSKPIVTKTGDILTELPVPRGTRAAISIAAYNRNKELWGEDAHEFRPERWLEPGRKGASLGVYANLVIELQAFLVELISNFEFLPTDKTSRIRRIPCGPVMQPFVEGEFEKGAQLPLRIKIAPRE
ncbi:hypothetical protein VNI00_002939 [Paramarasmius palmivorus]|uniref:Cytochrome P450 n=1 Tax=Paramarasmius palmivorus TaxID=297713 RepID=A0AAW0DXC3_9AGAR